MDFNALLAVAAKPVPIQTNSQSNAPASKRLRLDTVKALPFYDTIYRKIKELKSYVDQKSMSLEETKCVEIEVTV
jgi:hypothetical protein